MKKLLIVLIVLSACKKRPVKECWTVQDCKMIQVAPSVYEITLKYKNKTRVIRQSGLLLVGSNTCGTGNKIQSPF